MALGQTEAGRYLKVIYVPDPEPGSMFVITAMLERRALISKTPGVPRSIRVLVEAERLPPLE